LLITKFANYASAKRFHANYSVAAQVFTTNKEKKARESLATEKSFCIECEGEREKQKSEHVQFIYYSA